MYFFSCTKEWFLSLAAMLWFCSLLKYFHASVTPSKKSTISSDLAKACIDVGFLIKEFGNHYSNNSAPTNIGVFICSTARPTGGFRADYGFVGTLDAEIRRDLDREIGVCRNSSVCRNSRALWLMLGVHDLHGDQVFVETQEPMVNAATTTSIIPVSVATATTTTVDELTLAQTLIEIKAAKPKVRGVMIQEPSETTTTTTTPAALNIQKFLAISTLPPSPLTSYSSPLPVSSPPLPASPTHPLGYRAVMIRLRTESPSTSHPLPLPSPILLPHTRASMAMIRAAAPSTYTLASRFEKPPLGTPRLLLIPVPTSSPPLLLPSTDCRADVPEVTLPPQKRLCIAPGRRYKARECSSAPTARPTRGFRADYGFVGTLDAEIRRDLDREIGYGIIDTWDEMVEDMQGTPAATDVAGLSQRMTDFVMTVRQDTDEIYRRLDDAQDDRSLMSGQLNLLRRDRRAHARTARLESEARLSCKACVQSMDASNTT
ncbi:hypothetical protein Tco_0751095 [Tanacetum coccineum]|uniref:Uncharacterized protein n=1 Tax=Tanacetum coccineum TaxID=301880 RepID=A0ABQ4Z341_9ASTR